MGQELELRGRALPRRGVLKAGGTPGGLRGGPFYITDAAYTVHLIQKGLYLTMAVSLAKRRLRSWACLSRWALCKISG